MLERYKELLKLAGKIPGLTTLTEYMDSAKKYQVPKLIEQIPGASALADKLELLKSFKEYQISALIDKISERIFAALKSPNFNPQIAPYFTKINTSGPPFTDYGQDPDNVSQIKKLLNALYAARLTFLDLEHLDLEKAQETVSPKPETLVGKGVGFAKKGAALISQGAARLGVDASPLDKVAAALDHSIVLYEKTIDQAYEASYLATHLDVDIRDLFQDELDALLLAMGKVRTLGEENTESTRSLAKKFREYPISYKVGEVAGTALEQMQPSSGALDYDFLTQFSATLPSYIDKVTQVVKQYSSQLLEKEPGLNNAKLIELQETAQILLNDLESLKAGGGLFVSFKVLKYIHIIRNIITLSMSSLEQMGKLTESSQDLIRDNLAQLKYILLPQLLGLADKIEVNTMLTPGTLSKPLMEKLKPLYDTLIYYAQKPVDFKAKGEELLIIEDSRFVDLRLENTYQRIDKANKALFKIQQAQEAFNTFYEILSAPEYENSALHSLPAEVKAKLIIHYKLIKPYLLHVDEDFHKQITQSLLDGQSLPSLLGAPWRWLKGDKPADHMSLILAKKEALGSFIAKKKITQQFHITVNTQLIESVQKETDLTLFPYSDTTSIVTRDELEKTDLIVFPSITEAPLLQINEATLLDKAAEKNPSLKYLDENGSKVLENPEQLSTDQAIILYQWYRNKHHEFITASKAYKDFVAIIADELKEHSHIPAHILQFSHFSDKNKEQCCKLYRIFQPYFMEAVPKDMRAMALIFDRFLSQYPPSQIAAEPAHYISEFNKLESKASVIFDKIDSSWAQKTQFYLKLAKHKLAIEEQNVFRTDESRALRAVNQYDPTLKFTKGKNKKTVSSPEELNAEQALTLHQWYRNKCNKFEVASKAYNQFIGLLNEQASPKGSVLGLSHLSKDTKAQFRKLYHLFQPYFINGVPEHKRTEALLFDRYLVSLFKEDGGKVQTPATDLLEQLREHFQIAFTDIDIEWRRRSRMYLKYAQEQFDLENEQAPLAHDKREDRAHYLIKHTDYSKCTMELRKSLEEIIPLFSSPMQAELRIQASGIPFPELENPNTAAIQSKQVLSMKQIFNSIYHLEQIVRKLEELNDKSYKATYVTHLALAYSHINEIIKLTKGLTKDPHLSLISRELLDKAQNIWANIQENLEGYQATPTDLATEGKVQYGGLWYTLNAFYVAPRHIRSVRNHTYLTNEELDELHNSAKKSTLIIENLMRSSGSYFKLFLQAPNMFHLYGELSSKLTEFISTLHDTTKNNLDEFNDKIFTPMLLEADEWEHKLGLIPGTFSGPLKKIIDEFYRGLLHPLKLPSKIHLQLICDKSPIEQRAAAQQQNSTDADNHLALLDKNYEKVNQLHQLIAAHSRITGGILPASAKAIQDAQTAIIKAYKEALPRLVALKKQLNFQVDEKQSATDIEFDTHLNASLKEYDPKLTHIKALVNASHNHYLALQNTYRMKRSIAQEQIQYLTELSSAQDEANTRFVHDYTTESFDKQLIALANRHIGLQYADKEYCSELTNYLLTFKDPMVAQAKSAEDINLYIKKALKEKIRLFEQEHFAKYYQLDTIRVALAQFKTYFSLSSFAIEHQNSLFEDENTLEEKTAEINKLLAIAENAQLKIEDRIVSIQRTVINNPSFNRIILAHKQVDSFSLAYLALCVLSLLEALGLYTPDKKVRLNDLNTAVTTAPKISDLTKRLGLFSTMDEPLLPPNKPGEELDPDQQDRGVSPISPG